MHNLMWQRLGRLWLALSMMVFLTACPQTEQTVAAPEASSHDGVSWTAKKGAIGHSQDNCDNTSIVQAATDGRSDVQVKGCGSVIKVLPDDTKGSRHQKMIIKLAGVEPKRTVLIAHNIDLAPRVEDLAVGDYLSFYGEYEHNTKGGVVHWTHHDPAGRHQGGWIEKEGVRYE